jgi:anaerobic selenocysteine-containing dehydrogenase
MDSSPEEYDLYLISYKLVEHKQSRTTLIPLLTELSGKQRIDVNPATARRLAISDGDEVVVESHNAVTGETRSLTTVASLTDGIRPDVVGMPHHFGSWSHPASRDLGPTPNEVFFTGEGYMGQTADASFQVKVRIFRRGDRA